jgi:pyruvyltransferase
LDWDASKNWGDKLSPFLIQKMTGKSVYNPIFRGRSRYVVIGSILDRVSSHSIVWGAGFISADSKPKRGPKKIHAVRGPLTRNLFLENNIPCPKVFGDPAILMKYLLPGSLRREFEYGVIPHYVDKENQWISEQKIEFGESMLIIDIEGDLLEVIRQVSSCRYIFSSSLHGLICADAYGVPNTRLVLSDKIFGGDFKFQDYRLGIGALPHIPVRPGEANLKLNELAQLSTLGDVSAAAKQLIDSYPFGRKSASFPFHSD